MKRLLGKDVIVKSERLNVIIVKRILISTAVVFTLFCSIPEIHIFGFNIIEDIGRAASANELDVWSTPGCSQTALNLAVMFGAVGTFALFVFNFGLRWILRAKKASPLEFAAKALSIFSILIGVLFWGISVYIAGKCAYLYVSTLLF